MCVIGKILSVHDRNNSLVLLLSDGTGELEVNHWLQEESEQASEPAAALGVTLSMRGGGGAWDTHTRGAGVATRGPTVLSGPGPLCGGSLIKD